MILITPRDKAVTAATGPASGSLRAGISSARLGPSPISWRGAPLFAASSIYTANSDPVVNHTPSHHALADIQHCSQALV
ncbi:hypothetical protein VTN02DRAFT_2248 [Thermoascus thermophilus]